MAAPITTIDLSYYLSDGVQANWPVMHNRQVQPLNPLLIKLRDHILAHHYAEFLPHGGSLRIINWPPGYIPTYYISPGNSGPPRVVNTYHGHPRGGQWPSFASFIPHLLAIIRQNIPACQCRLYSRPAAGQLQRTAPFWQLL